MASTFDIGPSGDLAIFTNGSEDMFNTDGDIGPNFILDQGSNRGIVDVGKPGNLVSGITLDMPNEAPVDFGNFGTNEDYPFPSVGKTSSSSRPSRQKIESNVSNATIEAEPIRKSSRSKSSSSIDKFEELKKERDRQDRQMNQPPPFKSKHVEEISIDAPNFSFDDLLDNRKLKPVSNDPTEVASIGGESQSTIRGGGGYDYPPSEPTSPVYNAPSTPPLPSTIQSDRERDRRGKERPVYSEPEPSYSEDVPKYMNEDDERQDILLKLQALQKRKGIVLSKNYNMKSSLDELRMEYKNQSHALETEASIKFMRKGLIFCTSGVEYMNRRFDPVGAKLDGWGENVMENIMDFDGIFERLHDKYTGSVQMEPEMELLFALGGSAFMFHLSHTLFKTSLPQFGNVLRENPDVLGGILGVAKEAARRSNGQNVPMPANEMGGGGMGGGGMGGLGGMMGGMGGGGGGMGGGGMGGLGSMMGGVDIGGLLGQLGINGGIMSEFAKTMGQPPPAPQATREFQEPPVNDLYRQMMEKQQQQDNDDALSVNSNSSDRQIGQGTQKAVISPLPPSKKGGGGKIIKF